MGWLAWAGWLGRLAWLAHVCDGGEAAHEEAQAADDEEVNSHCFQHPGALHLDRHLLPGAAQHALVHLAQ